MIMQDDQAVVEVVAQAYETDAEKFTPEARLRRMTLYAEWLAAPAGARIPSQKKEVGELLGVSYETLRDYERDPRFQELYKDRVNAELKVAKLGEIVGSLTVQAIDPLNPRSVQAARLLLDWMDKHSVPDTEDALRNASLEEIRHELTLRAET